MHCTSFFWIRQKPLRSRGEEQIGTGRSLRSALVTSNRDVV
jgi:hypothetical protein